MAANKFHKNNTLLPQTTKAKISNLEDIDNFSLKLNKCVNWFKKDKIGKEELPETITNLQADKFKAFVFKSVYDISEDKNNKREFCLSVNAKFDTTYCENLRKQQRENTKLLCSQTVIIDETDLKANWRMIIGLGNESVYETSMTLHHVYGIPYIPASGIKGVIRNWVINENFNSQESQALENTEFVKIFGSGDAEGKVIFFDAFPINLHNDSIQPDIMNPHYPEYYDGDKPPADWQSPRPIFFLTLKETNFEFIFGVKDVKYIGLLETLTKSETGWLYRTLKEQGIGAKTAVGYGRSEKVKPEYYGDKKLKVGEIIEGEVINEGKKQNIKLHYKDNIENPIVNVSYGNGFTKEDIGKTVLLKINNLHGNKQKPKINPNGFEYIKTKQV